MSTPLAVIGHSADNRWVPGDLKLLRYFHDKVVGHTFAWNDTIRYSSCRCDVAWMPDVSRKRASQIEKETGTSLDWLRWPTKLDRFERYDAT